MDKLLYYFRPDEGDPFFVYWAKELLTALIIVTLFYGVSTLLERVLLRVGARLKAGAGNGLDGRMLVRATPPICFLINCTGWYFALRYLPIPEKLDLIARGALFVVIVVVLTNIAYRVLDEMLTRYGTRVAGEEMSRQLIPLVRKLFSIFLIGTALIITLKHFNYDILSLVTALGVGSLAIGLAAKDTLANMVSGFTLMLDRPFRIGDTIQLGTQSGEVVDIGLRSTKIKGPDSTFLIIPNSELCNSTLINMAFPDSRVKGRINVGVAYGSDVERVKEFLTRTAGAVPEVLSDPAPEAYLVNFGDSALNMALYFWVGNYRELFAVTDRINCAISSGFIKEGINIPYPTRTVLIEKDANHGPQD